MFTKESRTLEAIGNKTVSFAEAARIIARLCRMGVPAEDVESLAELRKVAEIYVSAINVIEGDASPKFYMTQETWGTKILWEGSWTRDRVIEICAFEEGEVKVFWQSGTGNPSRFLATIIW